MDVVGEARRAHEVAGHRGRAVAQRRREGIISQYAFRDAFGSRRVDDLVGYAVFQPREIVLPRRHIPLEDNTLRRPQVVQVATVRATCPARHEYPERLGKHAVVGTLDRLGDALRLVAATVPSFFGGARDDEIPCNKCGNGSLAAPRPAPSAANLQMLHNANALDIALYAYAAEHFNTHFDACFPR